MGTYISLSSEISGRALIGAWVFKGVNMVHVQDWYIFKVYFVYNLQLMCL